MSEGVPRAVLTEALREKINGREVLAAVFCTFRFDPGFFEREILPALFDLQLHQDPQIRRVQLEEALRPLAGRVAVYYDPRAIVTGDGTACLDVRRIPVRPRTGLFHPKNAFILVRDTSTQERSLVVLTASANLTQAGWWENVECAHLEEIAESGRSRTAPEVQRFLRHLRTMAKNFATHAALDDIHGVLRTVQPIVQRSANGRLHPHFLFNGRPGAQSLVDQLDAVAGQWLRHADLEVLSPYLDKADESVPLETLIDRFQPRKWRVLLPEEGGWAQCRPELYDWVCQRGGEWGRLPKAVLARGGKQAAGAAHRTVHAKVYRFFTKDREITLVGSFNLTNPAHSHRGNVESGVLSGVAVERRPRFWLEAIEEPPPFAQPVGEDDGVDQGYVPLLARYDWASGRAEVLWDGAGDSPPIQVYDRGVHLFEVGHLERVVWTALTADDAAILRERLRETSFLTAVAGDQRGIVLVHETGMAHRPSILLDLRPADILRYWSMLTAEQRNAYLAEHGEALRGPGEGLPAERPPDTIFDRFAGIFHGFASLGRAVRDALDEERVEEARFRMFGAKYDSLPVLVEQMASETAGDPLDRYLMVLCARQLAELIRRRSPAFWASDPAGVSRLEEALSVRAVLREQLISRNDAEMAEFLDWYEPRFLGETAVVTA
ncbi:hypothetical protein [Micromonospora purpureochromogenes]|uniref:PLD phosphodiesterase domain-containing protein n=1 Tax=Micromonospora purpureochromogenes TaxID=47872 RepID=A0ABX2RTF2_9ACTN|nr:hypothetical protein [Micromonospora purpureochromogenes]NYF59348.1 hypothetical protein [Micromonospora purpureochromogenes]